MEARTFPGGVNTAVLTPIHKDYSVNHRLLFDHCNSIVDRGGNGIILLGTTGEANSFSSAERMDILDHLCSAGFNKDLIMVSTGTCSVTGTIDLTRHAVMSGVCNVLIMPPFYYKGIDDEGLFSFYRGVIERVNDPELRIYLYHFPKMSGVDMSVAFIKRLKAAFGGVIAGIKDSGGDFENMKALAEGISDFRVYAGSERFLPEILNVGGVGCISATTNYQIEAASAVYNRFRNNLPYSDVRDEMLTYREAFEGHNFPSALKNVLYRTLNDSGWKHVRPPLSELDPDETNQIIAQLEAART